MKEKKLKLNAIFIFLLLACTPHLRGQDSTTVNYTLADTVKARELMEEAEELQKEGQKSEEVLEKLWTSKKIYIKTLGENNKQVAKIWNHIGVTQLSTGNFDEATNAFERASEIRLEIFDSLNVEVAKSYYNGCGPVLMY